MIDPQSLAHHLQFALIFYLEGRFALSDGLQGVGQVAALIGVGGRAHDRQLQKVAGHDQVPAGATDTQWCFFCYAAGPIRTQLAA